MTATLSLLLFPFHFRDPLSSLNPRVSRQLVPQWPSPRYGISARLLTSKNRLAVRSHSLASIRNNMSTELSVEDGNRVIERDEHGNVVSEKVRRHFRLWDRSQNASHLSQRLTIGHVGRALRTILASKRATRRLRTTNR